VLSAPGVLPITREKSNMSVFMVQYANDWADLPTNPVIQEIEAATNVHLNFEVGTEQDATEKLNLLLSSGQYPEVIAKAYGVGAADLLKYGAVEKMFIPLNDLIDKHAPNIKAYFAKYPWVKESITSSDGNIYGIPRVDAGPITEPMVEYNLWMNLDWLSKLGLQVPTTTEEFRTVLRAFKTRDPNGNGKADEVPLSGAAGTWAADPWLYLLNAFGYFSESLVMLKNGIYTPVANQDYIRDGLAYIKSLYDEGLLDPGSVSQSIEQLMTIGNNPEIILGSYTAGHLAMAVNNSNAALAAMYDNIAPLKGPTGYQAIPTGGDGKTRPTAGEFVITDKCKNPILAIKWADALCTDYWRIRAAYGPEGVGWVKPVPGTLSFDGVNPAKYKLLSGAFWGLGTYNGTLGFRLLSEVLDTDGENVGGIAAPANYGSRMRLAYGKYSAQYGADVEFLTTNLVYDVDTTARMAQIFTPLQDTVKSAFVEFITGRANLTTGWETYKQSLEQLGYSEYIKYMQAAYNAQVKK
jgi:putative aldouronate transport system substrate-binding protein